MAKFMFASEYAAHSGLPLATVKRMCKSKIIPNLRVGRNYRINPQLADAAVEAAMTEQVVVKEKKPKKGAFSFEAALDSLIK